MWAPCARVTQGWRRPQARPDFLTLRQTGFYGLRHSEGSRLIAANTDPRESDLTTLTAEDRALWTANATGQQDAENASGPDVKHIYFRE